MTIPSLLEEPFFALSLTVSGVLILHLWIRRRGSVGQKILWSILLAVPLLGALLYLAFYSPPVVQSEDLRAREHPDLWAAESNRTPSDHPGSLDHHI
jgi:hypothetical protein